MNLTAWGAFWGLTDGNIHGVLPACAHARRIIDSCPSLRVRNQKTIRHTYHTIDNMRINPTKESHYVPNIRCLVQYSRVKSEFTASKITIPAMIHRVSCKKTHHTPPVRRSSWLSLRGAIVNRTYGTDKNLYFTNNNWSYLL